MREDIILVDEQDIPCGTMEKQLVHQLGLLHRAFSVFIFNSKGEILLQKRAMGKYHSGGLWTNTCCSHPRLGEEIPAAISRRLEEEMGMAAMTKFGFSFIYKAGFENGLTEHEFDHVYFGVSDEIPHPEPTEVESWKYMNMDNLESDISLHPEIYTEWIKIAYPQVKLHFNQNFISS